MGLFDFFRTSRANFQVIRNNVGDWSYWLVGTPFDNDNSNYIKWYLNNPVLFAVISARAKLYSQMKITAEDVNTGKELTSKEVPHLALLSKPNYFQSQQDFLYQQMVFMSATGNDVIYQKNIYSNDEPPVALFNLFPGSIDYKQVQRIDKFFTLDKDITNFEKRVIEYEMDGKKMDLTLRDIIPLYDIANGLEKDKMLKSPSRVRAIRYNLMNIEENMKAENINLKMSQKYLARNKNNFQGTAGQVHDDDRKAIEEALQAKSLQITNGDIEVQHLVNDLKRLYLSDIFSHDATVVLNAFELNKDVINYALGGSTYENQQYGIIRYIQTSIQSDADNTMNSLTNSWGLDKKNIKLKASYNHLPVMQPLINEKIKTFTDFQNGLKIAIENQTISGEDAKKMTDKMKKDLAL